MNVCSACESEGQARILRMSEHYQMPGKWKDYQVFTSHVKMAAN